MLRYVRGDLADADARQVEQHAHDCLECRELLDMMGRAHADLCGRTDALAATNPEDSARALFRAMRRTPGPDRSGELVADKYRLGRRLGAGGMGVVYEAVNTWTERRVAIKLLHPWFSSDPETVARFHREARSSTRIMHASVVEVLDLGHDPRDGSLYLVQEFLTGDTLRQHLVARGRLTPAQVLETLTPIMEALAAAHQAGVVHRDVKPENIILSTDHGGRQLPKLIDFGISKITAGDVAQMGQTGRLLGTPLYMAPEQLRASHAIDGRADVWAMGVVVFELLAGRRPFEAASTVEAAVQILGADAPALRTAAADVPEAVECVVARALARDRERRFSTMREMLEALTAAAHVPSLSVVTPRPRRISRAAVVAGLMVTVALVGAALRTRSRPAAAGRAVGTGARPPVAAFTTPPLAVVPAPAASPAPAPAAEMPRLVPAAATSSVPAPATPGSRRPVSAATRTLKRRAVTKPKAIDDPPVLEVE